MINFNNARKTSVPQLIKNLLPEIAQDRQAPVFFRYSANALSRRIVADILNLKKHKIFFSYSFNEAILLIFNILKIKGFESFYVFASDWNDIVSIKKNFSFKKIYNNFESIISQNPKSVFYINHTDKLIGEMREIKRLSKIIKKYNSILVSDLSFSVGKVELNPEKYGIDIFLLNYFNFYTPAGGCLIADVNDILTVSDYHNMENTDYFSNYLFAQGLKYNFSTNFYKKILYFFINCKEFLAQFPYISIHQNKKQNPFLLTFQVQGIDAAKFAIAMKSYGIDFEFYPEREFFLFSFSVLNSHKDLEICKKFFHFRDKFLFK